MTDELEQLTDAQLSAVFAVEVAGWRFHKGDPNEQWVALHDDWWICSAECDKRPAQSMFKEVHPFATSADAVLPHLERYGPYVHCEICATEWHVTILDYDGNSVVGIGQSFARAACLALIRAKCTTQPKATNG